MAIIGVLLIVPVVVAWLNLDRLTAPGEYSFVQSLVFYAPRLPIAIIVITVIGFAIAQASRRADLEARDQRVASELNALPIFLDQLPDEGKAEFVQQVSLRYFPGSELKHDVAPPEQHGDSKPIWGLPPALLGSAIGTLAIAAFALYALTQR